MAEFNWVQYASVLAGGFVTNILWVLCLQSIHQKLVYRAGFFNFLLSSVSIYVTRSFVADWKCSFFAALGLSLGTMFTIYSGTRDWFGISWLQWLKHKK